MKTHLPRLIPSAALAALTAVATFAGNGMRALMPADGESAVIRCVDGYIPADDGNVGCWDLSGCGSVSDPFEVKFVWEGDTCLHAPHPDANPYKYGSKHLDTRHGLNLYDFEARSHVPDLGRFLSPDPHASDYHDLSPYIFCAANPIRHIDPTGMDTYLINGNGNLVNRTDSKEDIFIIVNDEGEQMYDDEGNELKIVLPEGTVKQVRKPIILTMSGDEQELLLIHMNGDDNAKALFEFMAQPGTTTGVEWSRTKTGPNSLESNIVGNAHHESKTFQGHYLLRKGLNITYDVHSHPFNSPPSGTDKDVATDIRNKYPNAIIELYRNRKYETIPNKK